MIAGPMFSNFMTKIAPAYGTNPFPAPPSNMINGATTTSPNRTTTPQATQAPVPAPQATQAPATQAPAPAPTSNGNGNGNGKGNG